MGGVLITRIPHRLLQALLLTESAMVAPFCVTNEAIPRSALITMRDYARGTQDNSMASAW
jgi:hypothetical protein